MTPASTRIVIFAIVVHLLLNDTTASFSSKDVLNMFRNPINDFIDSIVKAKIDETKSVTAQNVVKKDINEGGTMIDVPMNDKCKPNAVRDSNGVCREPW